MELHVEVPFDDWSFEDSSGVAVVADKTVAAGDGEVGRFVDQFFQRIGGNQL